MNIQVKYKKIILFIFSVSFFILSAKSHSKDVKEILNQISIEEKQSLTRLFYSLIQKDHLGYTLFGDKPVTISSHFTLTPVENMFGSSKYEGVFWNQWRIWKKYENLFLNTDYLFIEEPPTDGDNISTLVFINKQAFINKIDRNIKIFREILNSNVTGENLLLEIENKKNLSLIIKNNQILWGILLGYGVRNASLFDRREQIRPFFSKSTFPNIITKEPLPSKEFSSLKEEYDYLNAHLKQFDETNYSPQLMQSIHFMADSEHPETLFLKQKYNKSKGKISAIYAQGDFLEITLHQISK